VQVNGARLAYELSGTGELLMLIHGSNLATRLLPFAAALARHAPGLRLLRYHRPGYVRTAAGSASVGQQVPDALALLDSLGMPSATSSVIPTANNRPH
jgi:pimeloyl-ACP methyl ester carboxylesterase